MPGGKFPQCFFNPVGDAFKLHIVVVNGGNDVGYQLHVHIPFLFGSFGGIENAFPFRYIGKRFISFVCKSLDINTVGIQVGGRRYPALQLSYIRW